MILQKMSAPEAVVAALQKRWAEVSPSRELGADSSLLAPIPDWRLRISIPFPQSWPPAGTPSVVFYGFASRIGVGMPDGEEVTSPWARCVLKPGAAPWIELLRASIKSAGYESVRMLSPEEKELQGAEEQLAASLDELLSTDLRSSTEIQAPRLREYYRIWCRSNYLVSQDIAEKHPAFFLWLGLR